MFCWVHFYHLMFSLQYLGCSNSQTEVWECVCVLMWGLYTHNYTCLTVSITCCQKCGVSNYYTKDRTTDLFHQGRHSPVCTNTQSISPPPLPSLKPWCKLWQGTARRPDNTTHKYFWSLRFPSLSFSLSCPPIHQHAPATHALPLHIHLCKDPWRCASKAQQVLFDFRAQVSISICSVLHQRAHTHLGDRSVGRGGQVVKWSLSPEVRLQ